MTRSWRHGSTVLVYVCVAQVLSERFAAAAATSERALARLRRTGHGQVLVRLTVTRAMALLKLLDLDPACGRSQTAEEIARLQRAPRPLCFALWMRALIHYERGEAPRPSAPPAEYASMAVRAVEPSNITRNGTLQPRRRRARTRTRSARSARSSPPPGRGSNTLSPAGPVGWRCTSSAPRSLTGRLADAERFAQRRRSQHTQRLGLPAGRRARHLRARRDRCSPTADAPRAAALAEQAAAAADRIPAPLDAAEARLLAGRAHAAAGDIDARQGSPAAGRDRRRARRRAAAARRRRARAQTPRHARLRRRPARRPPHRDRRAHRARARRRDASSPKDTPTSRSLPRCTSASEPSRTSSRASTPSSASARAPSWHASSAPDDPRGPRMGLAWDPSSMIRRRAASHPS